MKIEASIKLFGENFNYYIGTEEKRGRLVHIRIDSFDRLLVGIDESGFNEEYEMADVKVIQKNEKQKDLTKQIIKQVNMDINSFKYDLCEYNKNEIIRIIELIDDKSLKHKLLMFFYNGDNNDSCEKMYNIITKLKINQEEKNILCGMIAYKQHDHNTAYKIFSNRWLKDNNNPDKCRDFILVADEFYNDVLCFFLLEEFFKTNSCNLDEKYYTNLWWKYIYYAIKYNNFDLLSNIEVTKWNVRVLLDSFIYIFYMYNMEHISVGLTKNFADGNNTILQRNNEDLGNIQDTIAEINLRKNYLPDKADGYYLRFESCMKRILLAYEKDHIQLSDNERSGYIYEYVKSRNYGFIIGRDFQKYFYHWDDLSQILKKRIMDNIYSGKDIESESMIYVQFECERCNNKIQAMKII